jgi:hypothetical protein
MTFLCENSEMPRPCAVEFHARGYNNPSEEVFCGCHGLVPWSFTLAATIIRQKKFFVDATALCRGGSRFLLNQSLKGLSCSSKRETPRRKAVASLKVLRVFLVAASVKLHGARPWHI